MSTLAVWLPPPGTIQLPEIWTVVDADYLESIFGVIQDFHVAGWCGAENIKERGITGNSLNTLSKCATENLLDGSLTGRILQSEQVAYNHIKDAAVRDYHIDWLTPAGMLVNVHSDTYPGVGHRFIVGPISFSIGDLYKDVNITSVTALEEGDLLPMATQFAVSTCTARPTLETTETFDVLHNLLYHELGTFLGIKIRVIRSTSTITNTVYVEICSHGV